MGRDTDPDPSRVTGQVDLAGGGVPSDLKIDGSFLIERLKFTNGQSFLFESCSGWQYGGLANASGPCLRCPNCQIGDTDTIWSPAIGSQCTKESSAADLAIEAPRDWKFWVCSTSVIEV